MARRLATVKDVTIRPEPGIELVEPGVWFSVASVMHPNFPPGTIIAGPYRRENAPRPGLNQSTADWMAMRHSAGLVDKIMVDVAPEQFRAQFLAKFHQITGAGDVAKVRWTRQEAEAAKVIAGPKNRAIIDTTPEDLKG